MLRIPLQLLVGTWMVELLQSLTSNNHKSNTLTPATGFHSFTHYSIVMVFKHLHIALWFLIIILFFTLLICFKQIQLD